MSSRDQTIFDIHRIFNQLDGPPISVYEHEQYEYEQYQILFGHDCSYTELGGPSN